MPNFLLFNYQFLQKFRRFIAVNYSLISRIQAQNKIFNYTVWFIANKKYRTYALKAKSDTYIIFIYRYDKIKLSYLRLRRRLHRLRMHFLHLPRRQTLLQCLQVFPIFLQEPLQSYRPKPLSASLQPYQWQ